MRFCFRIAALSLKYVSNGRKTVCKESVWVWVCEVGMVAASELVVIADSGSSIVAKCTRKLCFRSRLFRKRYEI